MSNGSPSPDRQFLLAFYAPQYFEDPFYHVLATSVYEEAKTVAKCFYGDSWIHALFYRDRKKDVDQQ